MTSWALAMATIVSACENSSRSSRCGVTNVCRVWGRSSLLTTSAYTWCSNYLDDRWRESGSESRFASGYTRWYTIAMQPPHSSIFYLWWSVPHPSSLTLLLNLYLVLSLSFSVSLKVWYANLVTALPKIDMDSVPDNDELAMRAELLLVRMCGVLPPRDQVNPILDRLFEGLRRSSVRNFLSCYTFGFNVRYSHGGYDSKFCLCCKVQYWLFLALFILSATQYSTSAKCPLSRTPRSSKF